MSSEQHHQPPKHLAGMMIGIISVVLGTAAAIGYQTKTSIAELKKTYASATDPSTAAHAGHELGFSDANRYAKQLGNCQKKFRITRGDNTIPIEQANNVLYCTIEEARVMALRNEIERAEHSGNYSQLSLNPSVH